MALFFPPGLRVRGEGVSRPLPRVPEAVQLPPDGPLRRTPAEPPGQVRPEQRNGPLGRELAPILRGSAEQFTEDLTPPVGHLAGPPGPFAIPKGVRITVQGVGPDPEVDGPAGDPQAPGDVCDRFAPADLQNGEGPAVDPSVPRRSELLFQTPPLPRSQGVHRRPPPIMELTKGRPGVK
jgi:hypothetical protein